MAGKPFNNRKILLLGGKSFLRLRKKHLRLFEGDRVLSGKRRLSALFIYGDDQFILSEAREIFKEIFREWKRLFIRNEVKLQ